MAEASFQLAGAESESGGDLVQGAEQPGVGEHQVGSLLVLGVPELKEKFFKNMSKRAAEMMRDDLESLGPTRLSDVEGAQKEILQIARKLAEEGKIQLGGGDEQFV